MSVSGQWQWQESGKAWKGVGIYHVTLSVASREPLLGVLVIPENDPAQAHVERTELGRLLLECQRSIAVFHPEIQILQYCLMPDHLHSIWYVRRPMEKGIRYAVQAFWRAAKKLGRGYTFLHSRPVVPPPSKPESPSPSLPPSPSLSSIAPAESRDNPQPASPSPPLSSIAPAESRDNPLPASLSPSLSSIAPAGSRDNPLPASPSPSLSSIAPAESRDNPLREMLGGEAYSRLAPVFTEMPFIRPMSRRGQLQTMIRYVQLNPQRLATKRLMPGFFRVQKGIVIAGRTYAAVGNAALLMAQRYATVHVRQAMVTAAEQGDTQPLRNYMNGCVLKARQGTVMVSPFISSKEKAVMNVLLSEQHPFIFLADNGFRDYYKPSGVLFDAVAAGRVLILSP